MAKLNYLSLLGNKLNNPYIGPKAYWSILNKFLNKKKIPLIPPISLNGQFIFDIQHKANLFNNYFTDQCKTIISGSTLPDFNTKQNLEWIH